MRCQESVLFAVPGKLSRFWGTLITLPSLVCIRHVAPHSTSWKRCGGLGSGFATERPLPGGQAPRPERKPAEYFRQITQQGLGVISWSGRFSCTGEVLLTLKILCFCNAIAGNKGFFYENARAVTGHARRLLSFALLRRRQERGSTPPATATPCSALPWVRMGVPEDTGCSRCRCSSPTPPEGVASPLMSAFRNKGYVCSARKSPALQKLAASPRTLLSCV